MKHSLLSAVVAIAGSFCVVTALPAQQPPTAHSLRDDAWALQFGIGSDFTLRPLQGGAISAKHHSSPARALRYGVSAVAEHLDADSTSPDRSRLTLGLVAHFLRYPTLARDPEGNLQMFWGLGPRLDLDMLRIAPPTGESDTRGGIAVGAGAVIGAEWFVRPRISLSAEYETALTAELSHPAATRIDWAIRLRPRGVLFGVSAYFH